MKLNIPQIQSKIKNTFNEVDFYEDTHTYIHRPTGKELTSVTTVLGKYKTPFIIEEQLPKFCNKHELVIEHVDYAWKYMNQYASITGTLTHNFLEHHYNSIINNTKKFTDNDFKELFMKELLTINRLDSENPTETLDKLHKINPEKTNPKGRLKKLLRQAKKFIKDHNDKIEPVLMEVLIYDLDYGVAGTFDSIFYSMMKNWLVLTDYKTNVNLKTKNKFQNFYEPIDVFEQTDLNAYKLQLSIYRHILEKHIPELKELFWKNNMIPWFSEKNLTYQLKYIDYIEDDAIKLLTHFSNNR